MNSKRPTPWIPAFAAMTLVLLAGCDSIGDGSTIEKLDIVPIASNTQLKGFEIGDTYKLYQCLRDELIVRATFTDGTTVNFSNRVQWSSSDPAVVEVSNGDVPAVLALGNPDGDGTFWTPENLTYGGGTVIPHGTPGQTAVITARFSSLSASIPVEIRKPTLRIVTAPNPDPLGVVPPFYLAQGTTQRLTVLLDADGRTVTAGDFIGGVMNSININPFRWVFTNGTFVPQDDDVASDVDQWVIDAGATRVATLRAAGTDAFVIGNTADYTPHQVYAELSLCQGSPDTALRPVADIQVATLYDDPGTVEDDRLVLSREAGFHPSGFAAEDLVTGTNTQLQLRGKLDANGDGSLVVDQHLNFSGYSVTPLNATCEDDETQLGCSSNAYFTVTGSGLVSNAAGPEGTTARVRSCTPSCLQAKATLEADDASVASGVTVNFTATAVDPPPATTVHYLFDFGDGVTQGPQAGATASHAYATDGEYTATVRLVDAAFPDEFLSRNAGAVRVLSGVTPPVANAAPVAELDIDSNGGEAPFSVVMNGSGSEETETGDEIVVYEFNPGDGSPVVRQTSPTFVHTYRDSAGSPYTPTLVVYDEHGVPSAVDTAADDEDTENVDESQVAVTGVAPEFIRSNVLELRARKAVLCSAEIQPTPAATPTTAAFSFPGPRFNIIGSFVADTDTDACTDPPIGTQLITRFALWTVRPAGVADEFSEYVTVRSSGGDFEFAGQVLFFEDVDAPTPLDVSAELLNPFAGQDEDDEVDPTPTTLTVTPCTTCTP